MKVLFVVPSFRNGGTITSLKNLIPQLDLSKYEIDVFAITNLGPNREYVQHYVNVLGIALDGDNKKQSKKSCLKSTVFKIVKSTKKLLDKFGVDISPIAFKSAVSKLEKNNYDIVIGFQEGQPTRFISYFKNAKRVAWVHCDYSNMLKIGKIKPQHNLYSKIDQIVCVSDYTKNVFVNLLPETKDKTVALHNLIDKDYIISKSIDLKDLDPLFKYKGFKIVSLGRIDPVKRFSCIPKIISEIKNKTIPFKWFVIGGGEGAEKELLLQNIKYYNVENVLILLGEKNNPYPYIKNADLLVSTSLSEACPYVINEAKTLHTPIVSTDFGSIYEFIENDLNGFISPIETIVEKIELMMSDKETYDKINNNISQFEYFNDDILSVLYNDILTLNK